MAQSERHVSDLTIEEFVALIRATVRDVLTKENLLQGDISHKHAGLLDIAPVSVGEWNSKIDLISREELYDDER